MEAQGQVRSTSRIRSVVRVFSVLSLTIFSVGLALSTLVFLWVPYEDTGISFNGNGDIADTVPAGSPAAKAGLRAGDRLDPAMPFSERERIGWSTQPAHGQTYTFRVLRHGALRTIHVHALKETTAAAWPVTYIAGYTVGMLAFLAFVIVGTVLVLVRPTPLTWLFFLFCVGNPTSKYFGALDVLNSLQMPLGFVLNIIRTTLLVVGYVAFVDFALRFPNVRAAGWRARVERALPLLLLLYLAYDYHNWFWQFYSINAGSLFSSPYTGAAIALLCEVIAVVSLVLTYRRSSMQQRHRLIWVVTGVLVTYSVVQLRDTLANFNMLQGGTFWICIGMQSLSAFAPLALAYGILKHRVIDVRFVINRAVVYAVVTSLLIGLLASTYWLIGRLLQQTQLAAILQLAVAIAIGISLQRSYKHIETLVNRWFFKSIYDAQEHLLRVGATLGSVESAQVLETVLAKEPVAAMNLTAGALFRRRDDGPYERVADVGWTDSDNRSLACDDPLVLHLKANGAAMSLSDTRFSEAYLLAKTNGADEAVPIFCQGTLTAIALYGPHTNGTKIDPLERSAIANLAAPAEQAYDSLRVRLDNVRRLSDILERLDTVAYDELHYYLAEQALAAIPDSARKALIACAAIPDATHEDVAYATGDLNDGERLTELASTSALIRVRKDGTYAVHPLMKHILLRNFGDARQAMLVRCAQAWDKHGRHGRAAMLYSEAGIRSAAADQLEAHYSGREIRSMIRSDEYAELCASLDLHEVLHRPNVWLKRCFARIFKDDARGCAREGQLILEGAGGQISPTLEALIRSWISWMQIHAGELEQSHALTRVDGSLSPAISAFIHLAQADAFGRSGNIQECEGELKAASDLFVPLDEFAAIQAVIRSTTIERLCGRTREERALLDHATQLFAAVGSRLALWSMAEAVMASWLCGDDAALRTAAKDLRTRLENDSNPTLDHFVASIRGDFPHPNGTESPRFLAYAYLVQACTSEDAVRAREYAERAHVAAMLAHEPYVGLLASIAQAKLDPPGIAHLAQAMDASDRIGSARLQEAIRAIVAGGDDAGMLAAFVARLEKTRDGSAQLLAIELASCAVSRGVERLQLPERELALAVAIARRPEPTSAIELAEMLWPDLDESAGLRAVQTYVHRLRQRLQDHDVIELVQQGYRYRSDTSVDLWQIERDVASVPQGSLGRFDTLVLARVSKQLNATRPGFTIGWEWFAPVERRMAELLRDAEYRMAKNALQTGMLDDALTRAKNIISRDELDEAAWELVIRCRLDAGDKAAAQREFRQYRDILERELHEKPSAEISGLITAKT